MNLANRELKYKRVQNTIPKSFQRDVAIHAIKFTTHLCLRLKKNKISAKYKLEQTFCSVDRSARNVYFGNPVNSSSSLAVCEIDLYQQLKLFSVFNL